MLRDLGLIELYPKKKTLNSVLQITTTALSDKKPSCLKEISMHYIYNVLRANLKARNTEFISSEGNPRTESSNTSAVQLFSFGNNLNLGVKSISILDLITAVFLCSDIILQQMLMGKMSLCHFALPLLLPDVSQDSITFLLWALRPVVHKWRPMSKEASKGYMEQSMVTTPMPMISFMRIGECRLSKSEIINSVISNDQHDFFVHRNMECGNFPRRLCNGLVEVLFHLPCGEPKVDVFSDIFAALNLRGDVRESLVQFQFLQATSDAVFVFVDKIGEKECDFLTSSFDSRSKLFFVMNPDEKHLQETEKCLNNVITHLKLNQGNILVKMDQSKHMFCKNITQRVRDVLDKSQKCKTLEDASEFANSIGIEIDEGNDACMAFKDVANSIISDIGTCTVDSFKKKMLPAQGELWQKWLTMDKEQKRLKNRGNRDINEYMKHLDEQKIIIRMKQSDIAPSDIINTFVSAYLEIPEKNNIVFLQWMKIQLDALSSKIMIPLQEEYKQLCSNRNIDKTMFMEASTKISNSSIGLEHFMREIGQIYEASKAIGSPHTQFMKLPSVMAQLLISGLPMELLDGDSSGIPIDWVTDVLTQVRTQLGSDPRIFVLTVLGVQSSGKSTLLNIMFGLQFAVSSGRCTRGAFMQLLRIDDELKLKLQFDFLLVIDTEGLKAPQLASLVDSYDHDNELATVVIGLSDVTIVNLSSENAEEMKDILQVVVHALLRMTEAGKMPNCLFIHQHSGSVAASAKNLNDKQHLLMQLDDMTRAAAKMEHKTMYYTKFADVIAHDMNKDSYFIPGLWFGSSAMAPVSRGYSEQAFKIKTYIFETFEKRQHSHKPCTLSEFSRWISEMWNSVKREKFIFSFRNGLVIQAYSKLCSRYAALEWEFRSKVISWTQETDNTIMNASQDKVRAVYANRKQEGVREVNKHKMSFLNKLDEYFSDNSDDAHLIVKYKADFDISVQRLAADILREVFDKCDGTVLKTECLLTMESWQNKNGVIAESVSNLLEECKKNPEKLTADQIKKQFEDTWHKTVQTLPENKIKMRNLNEDMYKALCRNLSTCPVEACDIPKFNAGKHKFKVIHKHAPGWGVKHAASQMIWHGQSELHTLSNHIIENCRDFIETKTNSKNDYIETYWDELLAHTDSYLHEGLEHNRHFSTQFVTDIKLHVCAIALGPFTSLHKRFIEKHHPLNKLPALKEKYFSMFTEMCLTGGEAQKSATVFCQQYLKPAFIQFIDQRLGPKIVQLIHSKCDTFKHRENLQMSLLSSLLETNTFVEYTEFLNDNKKYTKLWIKKHVINNCKLKDTLTMLKCLLDDISKKAKAIVSSLMSQTTPIKAYDILLNLKKLLERDIVLQMDALAIVGSVSLKDSQSVKLFLDTVCEGINQLSFDINLEFEQSMDVERLLDRLAVQPHEELFKLSGGCGKTCPLCKAPCDRAGGDHREHSTTLHYPQGLCGHTWSKPGKLSAEVCTASVSKRFLFFFKIHKFSNSDTGSKNVLYADYRTVNDYYASWDIPEQTEQEAPLFWKYVFCRFNNDLSKFFEAEPANIPKEWKNITKEQVQSDLQQMYSLKL
ncbi:unnamed protein product [Lampetra planeri]